MTGSLFILAVIITALIGIIGLVFIVIGNIFGPDAVPGAASSGDPTPSAPLTPATANVGPDSGFLIGHCLTDVVAVVGCEQIHAWEVFGITHIDAGPEIRFPGVDELDRFAVDYCPAAFEAYVGKPPSDTSLTASHIAPGGVAWAGGHRDVLCLIATPAGEAPTSLRNSGR